MSGLISLENRPAESGRALDACKSLRQGDDGNSLDYTLNPLASGRVEQMALSVAI